MEEKNKRKVCVCHGPSCGANFASDIYDALSQQYGNGSNVEVTKCDCTGHCSLANNIMIDNNIVISRNTPQNVLKNVEKALAGDVYGAGGGVDVDPYNLQDDKFLGI